MNAEDKFEARHQEIHDENTGVTLTLGTHVTTAPDRDPRQGLRWMRIAVPYGTPDGGVETKTSTITFGPDGQALKILPHVVAASADVTTLTTEGPAKVDKSHKHGKK